jgi:tagatose-1,6-bisphosphate aldolase non-catalytic subunit AgaZ/GatZ
VSAEVKLMPLQQAYDDLANRSLSRISCELGRLIYLASTREYNTGSYYHEGLADRFGLEAAQKALEIAHRQAFYKLSAYSLEDLVEELKRYLASTKENPLECLRAWHKMEPYRIAVPADVDATVARLFTSNLRLALAILRFRRNSRQQHP